MLEELFNPLKGAWESLVTDTNNWINYLGDKYKKGSDADTSAARESLSNMKFLVTKMDARMQSASLDTNAVVRDIATGVQDYLEDTASLYEDLAKRSQGDTTAEGYANSVQQDREAVSKQVQAIHEATSVLVRSSTLPGAGSLPSPKSVSTMPVSSGSYHPQPPTPPPELVPALPSVPTGSLFLDVMVCLASQNPPIVTPGNANYTEQLLFEETSFPLSDKQLDGLTQSWSLVVGIFFDPSKLPGTGSPCATASSEVNVDLPTQEANLLEVHGELENLYDQIEAKVIRTTTEILTSNI